METSIKTAKWQTVSEIQLIYKTSVKPSERPQIQSSASAYDILMQAWDQNKIEFIEQFKIVLLNKGNKVLGIYELSTGGISGTVVDVRLIFAAALKANASGIIMAHNHPSDNLKASDADKEITKKIVSAGKLLDIPVLDHLIVTTENYYSFADNGVL
ncbi:DNA repair protein [Flavobacterium noncentrifugens]|uniref:DNA repair protein radc n=1 Tax=Flavobacterium noncentrifugens TaxID=1128970 RepID=A0A1G8WYK7_9FLAO|nr:JAB domain-containing protein [Flavobacterium noncentrifugens]GEP51099.1 DNA repair protein [Flavobacterium noncentrifugens]SDJ83459.1 DNA repair protein radc [Flavobacterium noncentrifugens]